MRKIKTWITNHPVAGFFFLTYLLSWPLFYITIFLFPGVMILQGTLGSIAVFSPALSGIIISSLKNNKVKQKQDIKRLITFLLSWIISTTVLVLFIYKVRGVKIQVGLIIFSGFIAILPAYIMSRVYSTKNNIRQYLKTIIKPKGNILWYIIALLTFPIFQSIGYYLHKIFGHETGELVRGGFNLYTISIIIIFFLHGLLFAGGINEESGWRGFAIPKLQEKHSPLISSIIVWLFWALWHFLYDISSGTDIYSILLNRLFFNFLWAILFVWIFNKTKGSVLAPAIFHSAMNTSSEFFARTDTALFLFIIFTFYAILSDKMWIKKTADKSITNKKQGGTNETFFYKQ